MVQICRQIYIYFPPNLCKFAAELNQLGGKSSAYIGEGNSLHHAQKVLASAGERPYIHDKTGFAPLLVL